MNEWDIIIEQKMATHNSGAVFIFHGEPGSDEFGVSPEFRSAKLSALEKVALIRTAVSQYQRVFYEQSNTHKQTVLTD